MPRKKPPLEPSLFDFVSDFSQEVLDGKIGQLDTVEESSPVITFCENLFSQFFAEYLGQPIEGFDFEAKRAAAGLAERFQGQEDRKETRSLIALFEKFCDLYGDVVGGAYGSGSVTYQTFHSDYMRRLLARTLTWSKQGEYGELTAAIERAQDTYETAMKKKKW